ncbi:kinase-like domain-containing protein, partial [Lyophyllum atratum]
LSGRSSLYPTCYELKDVTSVGGQLAGGAFSRIYKGTFRGLPVCLKVVKTNLDPESQEGHWLKALAKESILWGQLSHPNLLPFYGVYRFNGEFAFVAPWMEHGTVVQYLENHPTSNRVLLLLDIVRGLQFLHGLGVIHGDLKGLNILVYDSGRAYVADFGISGISDETKLAWTSLTSLSSKGGTARFLAPEILRPKIDDDVKNTKATDIYAWACVAYQILAGKRPFHEIKIVGMVEMAIAEGKHPERPPAASPSWSAWGLTEDIWSLMESCWSTERAQRPTVDEVVSRLMAMLRPEDVQLDERDKAPSSTQFRELMGLELKPDEMMIDDFEDILRTSDPFA